MRLKCFVAVVAMSLASGVYAQGVPAEYQLVLTTLGKQGDFKDNVLKVNIPRNDLKVTVAGVATPTPFGFGGWVAMTKGTGGHQVLMGDLVLLQDEVNPVMSALLESGLEVTALHNHFFWDEPRIFYMHVHGHGTAADLARKLKPAVDLIGKASGTTAPALAASPVPTASGQLDTAKLRQIVGQEGEQTGAVYKFTIGRNDLKVSEMGAHDQRTHGPEHVGRVHGHERGGGDRWRRRDARVGSDACPEGAAPERPGCRRDPSPHDLRSPHDHLSPLLGHRTGGQVGGRVQGRLRSAWDTEEYEQPATHVQQEPGDVGEALRR